MNTPLEEQCCENCRYCPPGKDECRRNAPRPSIDRPGVSYDGDHSSESGLEDITPDRVIVNDGSITQLLEKIYG